MQSETKPVLSSHTLAVHQGNDPPPRMLRDSGMLFYPMFALASARRSTGINARDRSPIDPRSPTLTPP